MHEFDVIVDECEILPVNVFSPQSTPGSNPNFWIQGLEPWEDDPEGVFVQVFDRWGNKVYENERYYGTLPTLVAAAVGTVKETRQVFTSTPSSCRMEMSSQVQ